MTQPDYYKTYQKFYATARSGEKIAHTAFAIKTASGSVPFDRKNTTAGALGIQDGKEGRALRTRTEVDAEIARLDGPHAELAEAMVGVAKALTKPQR
ncbi:MAG: hypothetical protein MJE77_42940 [Proteobacteria bacterium]|nr:hypothetical protein [Pseudomonadota bacterium]